MWLLPVRFALLKVLESHLACRYLIVICIEYSIISLFVWPGSYLKHDRARTRLKLSSGLELLWPVWELHGNRAWLSISQHNQDVVYVCTKQVPKHAVSFRSRQNNELLEWNRQHLFQVINSENTRILPELHTAFSQLMWVYNQRIQISMDNKLG